MMIQIHHENAEQVRNLFDPLAFNVQVSSTLDGNTRGEIWVDHPKNPTVAAIWDRILTVYVAGNYENNDFNRALAEWIESSVAPTARSYGDTYFNLYCHPPVWQTHLSNILVGYRTEPGIRWLHTLQDHLFADPPLPKDFSLHRVDDPLLARGDLEERDWLQAWITSFWRTNADFLKKGVGFVALHQGNKVASLCISLFVSGKQVEFGTATNPEFQSRGLSTKLASACVHECLDRGLEPIWQCWDDNLPSLAVARKVGFVVQQKYMVPKMILPFG